MHQINEMQRIHNIQHVVLLVDEAVEPRMQRVGQKWKMINANSMQNCSMTISAGLIPRTCKVIVKMDDAITKFGK